MGWAIGRNYKGETIGYSVEAACGEEDCDEKIDKGLAYCCGDLEGVQGERGCGGYFCYEHLFFSGPEKEWEGQRCASCADRILAGGEDGPPDA